MTMRFLLALTAACMLMLSSTAFQPRFMSIKKRGMLHSSSLMESVESESAASEKVVPIIPKKLPSAMGIDYVPLATFLATGDFLAADDFTRNNLIKLAGPAAVKRQFVYWTDVNKIPSTDLATMERLWLEFSDGNFGYSVQKRVWDIENCDFERFIRRIGWTKTDGDRERKLKWFGANEFIYEVEKAPKGHLPLTSALRGTQLLKKLMEHPVWKEYDWKNYKDIKWEE